MHLFQNKLLLALLLLAIAGAGQAQDEPASSPGPLPIAEFQLADFQGRVVLVNFGGDLRAVGRRTDDRSWQVGVELPGSADTAGLKLELGIGALATSGDALRFLLRGGVRYPHILNPRTGWPVMRAPRSVTVLGDTCTEAGLLATQAMLHGDQAEEFLADQGVQNWVMR
jgi:thiamine biosynthesis lipoprotein